MSLGIFLYPLLNAHNIMFPNICGLKANAKGICKQYITTRPTSLISPFIIYSYFTRPGSEEKAKEYFSYLAKNAQESYYGKEVKFFLDKAAKVDVGRMAPVFTMADSSGKAFNLTSLKGKYVLVDFWASWCGPCREENPRLVKTYQSFNAKGFEVLGVAADDNKAQWLKANGCPFIQGPLAAQPLMAEEVTDWCRARLG